MDDKPTIEAFIIMLMEWETWEIKALIRSKSLPLGSEYRLEQSCEAVLEMRRLREDIRDSWFAGAIKCINCGYEWVAVIESSGNIDQLECSECGEHKGKPVEET